MMDMRLIVKNTRENIKYLTSLNVVIAIISAIITFFLLLISLIRNIKENIWELGILRSIGLNKGQIY